MKRKNPYWSGIFLSGLAFLLVCSVHGYSSLAYFTTYARAAGSCELVTGTETEIIEEIDGLTKHIRIQNTGEADCFVRVKVFAGSAVVLSVSSEGEEWKPGEGGYWYYQKSLAPGETSGELTVSIAIPEGMEEIMEIIDVIVVQECTPVLYEKDGTPYADWELEIVQGTGGETEG